MVPTVLVIFVAVTSIAVVIQMGILIALFLSVKKTSDQIQTIALDVHRRTGPIIETARELLNDSAPKVREITNNLVDTSALVKNQAQQLNAVVSEIVERTRQHVARADEVISRTVNTAGRVQDTVFTPVKRASSILHAINVGIGAFLGKKPQRSGDRGTDEGMFI
jgi:methyl-accepting chemotaxis protein